MAATGFGFGDQCIVLEEMGRALLCAPYFATAVLAAGAIMNAGTEAEKQALLPGIAAGETTATFAWVEDNGRWDAEGTALTATAEGGEIVLNGHKSLCRRRPHRRFYRRSRAARRRACHSSPSTAMPPG